MIVYQQQTVIFELIKSILAHKQLILKIYSIKAIHEFGKFFVKRDLIAFCFQRLAIP